MGPLFHRMGKNKTPSNIPARVWTSVSLNHGEEKLTANHVPLPPCITNQPDQSAAIPQEEGFN